MVVDEEQLQCLAWKDIEPNVARWHKDGLQYLADIWPDISKRVVSQETWGDEVECQLVQFNHETKEAHLSLSQEETLSKLPDSHVYQPEFARFMIETEPDEVYGSRPEALLRVEEDLKQRRATIDSKLRPDEKLMTLSVFPRLGADYFIGPGDGDQQVEDYDSAVSNGKYGFAMENVTARAGRPRDIRVPIFRDKNTKLPKSLILKHFVFGPGACGLQATFQCQTLRDARKLHDQLTVVAPIFLALTAATPVYKGVLVDTDARVNQVAQAVDDRSAEERTHLANRWSTTPLYLEDGAHIEDANRGLDAKTEEMSREYASFLKSKGMDAVLAKFFATIHLRDPIYLDATNGDPNKVTPEAIHLSLLSSFWSHVRLKIPEPNSPKHGWRVEFRPMELQQTDFANAAVLIFLNLLRQTFAWLGSGLNLWMPLHLVERNIQTAHARNALLESKFWFPQDSLLGYTGDSNASQNASCCSPVIEMTVDEIMNGKVGEFEGLIPAVERYLAAQNLTEGATKDKLQNYIDFIRGRANGTNQTTASWIRHFVQKHPSYKQDSVVDANICYDMLCEMMRAT